MNLGIVFIRFAAQETRIISMTAFNPFRAEYQCIVRYPGLSARGYYYRAGFAAGKIIIIMLTELSAENLSIGLIRFAAGKK